MFSSPHCGNGSRTVAVALLALALALPGCSSVLLAPDPTPATDVFPSAWSSAVSTTTPTELAHWWRRFNDPMLTALVTRALQANPDVRAAQAALRQARAQRDVVAAGLYPVVNAAASGQRSKADGRNPVGAWDAGFDAGWEPDVFGGTAAGVAAADADARASAEALANTQVLVAAEVAINYMTLAALELRLAIARDNLASQEETLQIAQWRAQAGLTTALDVEQARTTTETTRAQLPALDSSLTAARNALAVLTGMTPEALRREFALPTAVPTADDGLALAFPAETLRQRPDVRAAEQAIRAAASRVSQADAARYPSFQLSGTLGLSALTLGGLTGGGALAAALLGSVSVPVFTGGRLDAQVRVQEAALDQARIAYEAVVLTALKEVEDALVQVANSRERLATLRRAAEAARLAALLARHRYASGLIDFTSVLQTQVAQLSADDSVADAQAVVGIAHVRLYKALGGGWAPQTTDGAGAASTSATAAATDAPVESTEKPL